MKLPPRSDEPTVSPIRRGVNRVMKSVATRWGRLVLGGLLGTLGVAALVVGVVLFENYRKANAGVATTAPAPAAADRPTRVGPDTIQLPPEVVRSLDVRTAPAVPATRPRPLPPFA